MEKFKPWKILVAR